MSFKVRVTEPQAKSQEESLLSQVANPNPQLFVGGEGQSAQNSRNSGTAGLFKLKVQIKTPRPHQPPTTNIGTDCGKSRAPEPESHREARII